MLEDYDTMADRIDAGEAEEVEASLRALVAAGVDDDDEVLKARALLVWVLNEQEKWAEAERESRALLDDVAGDEGQGARFVRRQRGRAWLGLKQPKAAVKEFVALLRILRKQPDVDGQEVALVRGHLGMAYLEAGRCAKAEPELRAALDVADDGAGKDSDGVLGLRDLLSQSLFMRKRYAEAAVELDPVLESYQRSGRSETPEALSVRALRAVMVAKNEEFALALQELREVHETQKRVLGDDHEDTRQTAEFIEGVTYRSKEPWRNFVGILVALSISMAASWWFLIR